MNNTEQRIVCWFSCGAASAVATKLAIIENNNRLPLVVARCMVKEEHPDNDRFAKDCEDWFGVKITNLINEKYNGSIYNVFNKVSYISGISGAPCTRLLKKEVRQKFELPTDHHVFGYCVEEQDRWDRFLDSNNINAHSPLIDRWLTHSNCLAIINDANIRLPEMYHLGYKHNNCIGCCKSSGAGYWNKIRADFPSYFNKMATESRRLGVKIIKIGKTRTFLDELDPNTGNYSSEDEFQCGMFCEMAKQDMTKTT